jgi:hypothetical protein
VYNYNSFQTTVRKTFSQGFGFQVAYTWSKNLSNVGFLSANLNDPTDMWQQYGQTPYSRPHRFVVSYQYELPFRAQGALNHAIGGWSIQGVTLVQSGNPLTFFDARGGTVFGLANSNTYEQGLGRAQLCPGVTYDQVATSGSVKDRLGRSGVPASQALRFVNPAAFCAPPSLGGGTGFGDSGVGILRGPGQLNFDFSIFKSIAISERQSLTFRTEFFNIFNHAQFAIPTGSAANSAGNQTLYGSNAALVGVITSTSVNPRLVQFALRYQF